jgi:tRNA (guanine37-N1)-methyltransferase
LYDIEEVSIGDFILTGGEPAAAAMVDAVARLIPGVLGNFESALDDSHMEGTLGAPCYTRPAVYEDLTVPEVLLSGDHKAIETYRRRQAADKCKEVRPDLFRAAGFDLDNDA